MVILGYVYYTMKIAIKKQNNQQNTNTHKMSCSW